MTMVVIGAKPNPPMLLQFLGLLENHFGKGLAVRKGSCMSKEVTARKQCPRTQLEPRTQPVAIQRQ